MTFQQFCDELNATYDERRQLVHFLAAHRSMTTIECLMPPEPPGASAAEIIDAWRNGREISATPAPAPIPHHREKP